MPRRLNPFGRLQNDEPRLVLAQPPGIQQPKIPSPPLLVDAQQQIASLQRQLTAAHSHIARLQAQADARPAVPVADRQCPSCAGLLETVAMLKDERGSLRKRLAGYELAATRGQLLQPSEQLP